MAKDAVPRHPLVDSVLNILHGFDNASITLFHCSGGRGMGQVVL